MPRRFRFYRVHQYDPVDGSFGFAWTTSKAAAVKEARTVYDAPDDDIEEVYIEPTKAGILAALNIYASHPDNG